MKKKVERKKKRKKNQKKSEKEKKGRRKRYFLLAESDRQRAFMTDCLELFLDPIQFRRSSKCYVGYCPERSVRVCLLELDGMTYRCNV